MASYLYGIKSVKHGAVVATGSGFAMPASGDLTPWAYTVQGSLTISEDESTTTEFYVEEVTTPVHSIVTDPGKLTMTWRAYDMTPDLIAVMKGGTAATGTGVDYYYGPESVEPIERSLEITTTNDIVFEIPRASCLARFDSVLGRENLLEMEVKATALAPETTGAGATDQAPYRFRIPTT
ncbi:MAG TPA: hypothetical protein PKX40_21610 [Spirochaetota bacterium]|nr:hypothetical protein [Spirochaetota bacterium]